MEMSITMTDGFSRRASATACSPLDASAQIFHPDRDEIKFLSPARTAAWSSTIRMLVEERSKVCVKSSMDSECFAPKHISIMGATDCNGPSHCFGHDRACWLHPGSWDCSLRLPKIGRAHV